MTHLPIRLTKLSKPTGTGKSYILSWSDNVSKHCGKNSNTRTPH